MDILLNEEKVGSAQVWRRGLYWCFECRCQLPGVCVLEVQTPQGRERLGIPVPEGGAFCLRKQIPVSRLGEGRMTIVAVPKGKGRFIPVHPDEPFQELHLLAGAVYQVRDGQAGLIVG